MASLDTWHSEPFTDIGYSLIYHQYSLESCINTHDQDTEPTAIGKKRPLTTLRCVQLCTAVYSCVQLCTVVYSRVQLASEPAGGGKACPHLVGENIHRYPTSTPLNSLECQVSKVVNSDTCARPTARRRARSTSSCSAPCSTSARRQGWGSVALFLCTTAHPLLTIFTSTIGASFSETTMRPNPTRRRG